MSRVANFSNAGQLFDNAKANHYAIPAVNVISGSVINATLEAAKQVNSPVIIQFSHNGSHFFAGRALSNKDHQGSALGAVVGAKYVHEVSDYYSVPVLLNTDHASRKLLPWVDKMLEQGVDYYARNGVPLFTSHMIDLSDEPLDKNIETCKRYLEKVSALNMYLEIELGVTGGEEDGVDNTGVDSSRLYTQPEDVQFAYGELMKVSDHFVIAASFGNVHGVYHPGNVRLEPVILKNSQERVRQAFNTPSKNPVHFVFHGGSGSDPEKITEALEYGVVKMNIDTDIQWAFWDGVRRYYHENSSYMESQLGNPTGLDKPNKKYYDPRSWLREGENSVKERLLLAFKQLNALDRNTR